MTQRHDETGDVIVLGAGMSGLVGTAVLLAQGARSVTVLDEYDRVGGNHIDVAIGGYTFDVGSLIFQDDSPLLDHFPELLDRYVPVEPSWGRINPQGVVTEYPLSVRDDLLAAGPVELARLLGSAAAARLDPRPLRSAHDFARRAVGSRFLSRSGLEHYMERFCGCPTDEIELAFARSRMAWVADQTRPGAAASRLRRAVTGSEPPPPENTQLVRPREGFAELYAPARASLEQRGARFELGSPLRRITPVADGFEVVAGDSVHVASRLVSTIPVHRALQLAGLAAPPLPTVTLLSLFYSFEGDRGFRDPILYNFTHDARWKRLTTYSDFYGRVDGREYLTVEVVGHRGADLVPEDAHAELRSHTAGLGLFDGDLRLEGHHELDQAYPIHTRGSGDRAAAARARLARLGVESFGRQGGFQYQPTARVSTLQAEQALGVTRS